MSQSPACRVLIAALPLMGLGIRKMLQPRSEFEVVGETALGRQVMSFVRAEEPDLLVLQADLGGLHMGHIIVGCRTFHPRTKVLVLEGNKRVKSHKVIYLAKPHGFLSRDMSLDELQEKARQICSKS